MESNSSYKPHHNHVQEPNYSPKTARLSLLISRPSRPPADEDPLPPPSAAVSVPFKWEEAPGKPRKCHTQSEPDDNSANKNRTLELPPRLLFLEACSNMDEASPTTVLGGPYVGRAVSFTSSYRTPRDYRISNFGSARWSSSRKITQEDPEAIFDFSGTPVVMPPKANNVKIGRNPRRQSSLSLSHLSKGSSHFWASIYESFKHMVPWRRCKKNRENGFNSTV